MQITRFTDYGLRTLMYVASCPENIASVKEISEYYGISRNHLVKVVHKLSKLGFLETIKGKGGGIKIAEKTDSIRLGDLIKLLEPNMYIAECFNENDNGCKITNSCKLKHYFFEASQNFINTLNKYTLADTIHNKELIKVIPVEVFSSKE
ncbi:Rrf2 family transcriptional regulator [Thorsellia kenyensis]|uniref:Rrf2 family transcriptional regulator n=1 Tax=Thorsellia kenyensis TaxID=1549888 RepID=A0ABV6C7V5_9GAMM